MNPVLKGIATIPREIKLIPQVSEMNPVLKGIATSLEICIDG